MSIYGTALTFKDPTAAEVPLNEQLVKVIKTHHQKSREYLFHVHDCLWVEEIQS